MRTINSYLLGGSIVFTCLLASCESNGTADKGARLSAGTTSTQFVTAEGTRLVFKGRPFHFVGANCYYLMVYATDPARRTDVDSVLRNASEMGVKVIRTWAFNDKGENALQTSPGVYDERVFQGLDYVVAKAEQLGLRLMLVLVNNWDDYGGMNQWVKWSPTAKIHDDFYNDINTRNWFRRYISTLVNRRNSFSGKLYKDDPTILAWELANEPRASNPSVLTDWIQEMSRYLKHLDSNHLVTTGSEGLEHFIENHQVTTIDFATVHLWPDTWHWGQKRSLDWLRHRIGSAHNVLRKPLILGEFGKHRDIRQPASEQPKATGGTGHTLARDQFYSGVLNEIFRNQSAGALFWTLYHDTYPDYDGFGVYYPTDRSTVEIINAGAEKAQKMAN